jgi:hypothetical protein
VAPALALPAPFGGHDASSIDAPALVCKASELIGLIALVALAVQGGQLLLRASCQSPSWWRSSGGLFDCRRWFLWARQSGRTPVPQWQHAAEHSHEEVEHGADHGEHALTATNSRTQR